MFYRQDGSRRERSGVDVVVGNPPYTRIQRLSKSETAYYDAVYKTASGSYDIYTIFAENGAILLNSDGRLGYILPNKVFRVDYGAELRELLSANRQVSGIVDFGSNQVFADAATTYTAILFLQGTERREPFRYWKLEDNSDPTSLINTNDSQSWSKRSFENNSLSRSPWNFQTEEIESIIDSVEIEATPLGEIAAAIGRGTSTGNDEVFELEVNEQQDNIVSCSSEAEADSFQIEAEILRKPIHSTDFDKYAFSDPDEKRLIWPYDHQYNLVSEDDFVSKYPNAYRYLERHRESLESRADYSKWYAYSAPRNLSIHDHGEILIPLLADSPSFSKFPEPQSDYVLMASGGFSISFPSESDHSTLYLLSLINSKLLFLYLQSISNIFRGGYVTCTKQYFKELPIREITFSTPRSERKQKVAEVIEEYDNHFENQLPVVLKPF